MGGKEGGNVETETCRHKEGRSEESCREEGGSKEIGGEEGCAGQEIGGEEVGGEEDRPGCCTGGHGRWRSVGWHAETRARDGLAVGRVRLEVHPTSHDLGPFPGACQWIADGGVMAAVADAATNGSGHLAIVWTGIPNMADEPDGLPDTVTLASDIQKAMNAYGELQTYLTAAIKPLQDQWAALSSAIKPIQERVTTAALEWNAVQERWQKQSAAIQDSVTYWARIWSEAGVALGKELADFGPRLLRTLESADHVGRLGWTVTKWMRPSDMAVLSQMHLPGDADAYMLAWYEAVDLDLDRLEKRLLAATELEPFRTPLTQCFTAYRRGDYAISILFLASVLEGGIRNLVPMARFFSTNVQSMVKDLYDKVKEDDPDTIEVYFWMSLYTFVQWFYKQYGPTASGEDRIFRHGT